MASESRLKHVTLAKAEDMHNVWDINELQAKAIHIKITEMIALDCQPHSVVDYIGFGALIHTLEPKYNISSRRYFSETVISSTVGRIVCVIRSVLKVAKYFSFTTDVWSSNVSNNDYHIGQCEHYHNVITHYITYKIVAVLFI